ncbi:MAG: hypothetical protein KAU41_10710 [Deltaproteobacteria bacterium]|nr:hypothetical protein [Deltaproteobacteria bacterium]
MQSTNIYPAFFKTEDLAILLDTEQDSVGHEQIGPKYVRLLQSIAETRA